MTTIFGKYYSLRAVEVSLSAPLLTGDFSIVRIGAAWGDDGGIEFERAEDAGDFLMGASGFPTWVGNNNPLYYANITVAPNSNAYRKLGGMYQAWLTQMETLAQFIPIAFLANNRSSGTTVPEPSAGFISSDNPNMMKAKTDGVFRIGLPNADRLIQRGLLSLTGP